MLVQVGQKTNYPLQLAQEERAQRKFWQLAQKGVE